MTEEEKEKLLDAIADRNCMGQSRDSIIWETCRRCAELGFIEGRQRDADEETDD